MCSPPSSGEWSRWRKASVPKCAQGVTGNATSTPPFRRVLNMSASMEPFVIKKETLMVIFNTMSNTVIMHVYIASEPGNPVLRRCTVILSLTQTWFHPAHISTPKGAYNARCHYRHKALLKHIAIASCQVLIVYGWVNQSPHDNIAAPGDSNPRPFGYESYAPTNCTITARYQLPDTKTPHLSYYIDRKDTTKEYYLTL